MDILSLNLFKEQKSPNSQNTCEAEKVRHIIYIAKFPQDDDDCVALVRILTN